MTKLKFCVLTELYPLLANLNSVLSLSQRRVDNAGQYSSKYDQGLTKANVSSWLVEEGSVTH